MIGNNSPHSMQSKRENAQFPLGVSFGLALSCFACERPVVAWCPSKHQVANCQHCYPSPDRSAPLRSRPISFMRKICLNSAIFSRKMKILLESKVNTADSAFACILLLKGRKLCLRNLGSLRLPQHLHWQVASTQTVSAHLLVLASVALLAKPLATTIALKAHLLAALSERLPTTSKVAQQLNSKINETAAAGHPCVRRFCV